MTKKISYKKITNVFAGIFLISSSIFLYYPNTTHALGFVPTSDTGLNPKEVSLDFTSLSGLFSGIKAGAIPSSLDSFVTIAANSALKMLNQSVFNIVKDLNGGGPAFITNLSDYFAERTDIVANANADRVSAMDIPEYYPGYKTQLTNNLRVDQVETNRDAMFASQFTGDYIVPGVTYRDFQNDFKGGWGTFAVVTSNPAKEPVGTAWITSMEAQRKIDKDKMETATKLGYNKGTKDLEWCNPDDPIDCTVKTPGVYIQETASAGLQTEYTGLLNAKEMSDAIDKLITGQLRKILQDGF